MITSGGLGTMGYGVPSAIGAKVAKPDHIVVDIDGDASFSMTGMELATASQFNIGAKFLILNNEFQGYISRRDVILIPGWSNSGKISFTKIDTLIQSK